MTPDPLLERLAVALCRTRTGRFNPQRPGGLGELRRVDAPTYRRMAAALREAMRAEGIDVAEIAASKEAA